MLGTPSESSDLLTEKPSAVEVLTLIQAIEATGLIESASSRMKDPLRFSFLFSYTREAFKELALAEASPQMPRKFLETAEKVDNLMDGWLVQLPWITTHGELHDVEDLFKMLCKYFERLNLLD